jgi:hypothetical protein
MVIRELPGLNEEEKYTKSQMQFFSHDGRELPNEFVRGIFEKVGIYEPPV